jgi:branched-chain amino acid transport system permease protein
MSAPPVLSRRRVVAFGAFLAAIVLAPLVFTKGYALSLLCQIGIMTIFALSYNVLLGQTGLLSFGHAVYYGLGAFGTLHALNLAGRIGLAIPVTLLPLVGGVAGLLFGLLFGWVTTRRAGTTFAMISLGIGEMVAASSLMLPAVFGGEGGISGNRVTGKGWFGITYGPQLEMYYLIVGWAVVCMVAMFALTQTPLGRMANAVRDNPERAQFVGYDPQWVRTKMVVLAGFFAGISGGLAALNYEMATAESLSAHTSGTVVLMAVVGGTGSFAGPIIGAALVTVLQIAVAGITKAWLLYFGLLFLLIVLQAPGGIAGILLLHRRAWRARMLGRLAPAYGAATAPAALLAAGLVLLVELAYAALEPGMGGDSRLRFAGLVLETRARWPWLGAAAAAIFGAVLLRRAWRAVGSRWAEVHAALQAEGR